MLEENKLSQVTLNLISIGQTEREIIVPIQIVKKERVSYGDEGGSPIDTQHDEEVKIDEKRTSGGGDFGGSDELYNNDSSSSQSQLQVEGVTGETVNNQQSSTTSLEESKNIQKNNDEPQLSMFQINATLGTETGETLDHEDERV